jgi:hypothetical protein
MVLALGGCQAAANVPLTPEAAIGAAQGAMVESVADRAEANAGVLAAAYAEALADAPQPGDDELSCEALMAEMDAIMTDPEMQASQAAIAEGAEDLAATARLGMAQGAAVTAGRAVLANSTAGAPGAGLTNSLAGFAATAVMVAQARIADAGPGADVRAEVASIMGPSARVEHLAGLYDERQCGDPAEPPESLDE